MWLNVIRMLPMMYSFGQRIASNTCDANVDPVEQADPEETSIPSFFSSLVTNSDRFACLTQKLT